MSVFLFDDLEGGGAFVDGGPFVNASVRDTFGMISSATDDGLFGPVSSVRGGGLVGTWSAAVGTVVLGLHGLIALFGCRLVAFLWIGTVAK